MALAHAYSLDAYPLAKCLDGSAARYYLRLGSDPKRWLIFHEGGGFCTSINDCSQRAKSYLGSTVADAPTLKLDRFYFSQDAQASPFLSTATHVYIRYCDGAYYSGDREEPVLQSDGPPIYFRGRHITTAVIDDLYARHALASASDIVFGGCSAGAIRLYAHLDALRALMPNTTVVGFADSGFYLDVEMFTPLKHFVTAVDGQNATALLAPACKKQNVGTEQRCLVAQVSSAFLRTPTFAFQSRYDVDQRSCEMPPSCAASTACVNSYGANSTRAMHAWLRHSPSPHAAFIDACSRHCDDGPHVVDPLAMQAGGLSPLQAFAAWHASLSNGRLAPAVWQQPGSYPCRACCTSPS